MGSRAHYLAVLGLPPEASNEDATSAYKDLIRVWHPDRFQNDDRLRRKAEDETKKLDPEKNVIFIQSMVPEHVELFMFFMMLTPMWKGLTQRLKAQAEIVAKAPADGYTLLMSDIAHYAGLVATGLYPSPVGIADFVTSTTHKTLRGPRGGMVLTNDEDIAKKIEAIGAKTKQQIRAYEDWIRWWCILLPPLPAIVLGVIVLSSRINAEYRNVEADRLVKR